MQSVKATGVRALSYVSFLASLQACTAEVADPEVASVDETGEVTEPLHENTCWTQAAANATITIKPGQGGYYVESTNGSYGQPGCPNQWIVDVKNILGKSFTIDAGAADQIRSGADWCPGFWSFNKVRGLPDPLRCAVPQTCNWQDVDNFAYQGSWEFVLLVGPMCASRPMGGAFPAHHAAGHGFEKLRIVTSAGWALSYAKAFVHVSVP